MENIDDAPIAPISKLVESSAGIVNKLIPVVFAIALLVFLWGVVKYIANSGDESAKIEGRRIMIGGIIALFVIASVWGIIAFLGSSLKVDQGGSFTPPSVNFPASDQTQ